MKSRVSKILKKMTTEKEGPAFTKTPWLNALLPLRGDKMQVGIIWESAFLASQGNGPVCTASMDTLPSLPASHNCSTPSGRIGVSKSKVSFFGVVVLVVQWFQQLHPDELCCHLECIGAEVSVITAEDHVTRLNIPSSLVGTGVGSVGVAPVSCQGAAILAFSFVAELFDWGNVVRIVARANCGGGGGEAVYARFSIDLQYCSGCKTWSRHQQLRRNHQRTRRDRPWQFR